MKRLCIALIRGYQRFISPIKPPCCRFTPTCSAYAIEAFEKRGFFAGLILSLYRILREGYRTATLQKPMKTGFLIVIAARERAVPVKSRVIARDIIRAFTKLELYL